MISLRDLKEGDILSIRDIALRSWRFAYQNIYKEKTILRNINEYYSDSAFERHMTSIAKGKGKFIVALQSEKIVGYIHATKEHDIWEVIRIYVDPNVNRRGIGSKLLERMEQFLKKKGVKSYIIYPHIKNRIAVNFYKKTGFHRNKELDRGWNSPCYEKDI